MLSKNLKTILSSLILIGSATVWAAVPEHIPTDIRNDGSLLQGVVDARAKKMLKSDLEQEIDLGVASLSQIENRYVEKLPTTRSRRAELKKIQRYKRVAGPASRISNMKYSPSKRSASEESFN